MLAFVRRESVPPFVIPVPLRAAYRLVARMPRAADFRARDFLATMVAPDTPAVECVDAGESRPVQDPAARISVRNIALVNRLQPRSTVA